ncbi:hypothetical protein [Mesorhizobium erdmanii]|uniref:Uncharacterized protein n=1 Tax=Mesorhizobium erdmanii TaxID=1777866 RepID=A0A6M7UMR8_9HYPH|nr:MULTISPECIES: hypothetical protein [Mesorhizobium]OBQ75199.1 hypothetical protein A8146_05725 [Mesorhizobium loti]QKC77358.1 hypothetical protein EB233_19130 [Mesorhizobium erdmanii]
MYKILAMLIVTLQPYYAHAGERQPVARVVSSLFKEHQPFNRHAEQVEYFNAINIACGIDNERTRAEHRREFAAAEAEIGKEATRDQMYLAGIRNANILFPAGAHERYCSDARALWGE